MVDLEREYKDFDGSAGLQRSQTLDESFYGTSDTERDRDQVVYKWFNSINKTDRPGNGETTASMLYRIITRIRADPRLSVCADSGGHRG